MPDIGEVTIQIRASAEGVDTAVQQAQTTIKTFAANVDALTGKIKFDPIPSNIPEKMRPIQNEADQTAIAFAALAAAAKMAFDGIMGAIDSGIEASQRYSNAIMGLESVATGKGIGAAEMQAALDGVTDAFFSAADASTAFKNLLSRGYSIDQATQTIQRLKEAAAFGRQANLGFAQSIVTATEGIKNENSVLVDNAGVTKNVAKMWESYAKTRGLVTAELTQAQKVEAEYLGIMEETTLQVGDFSKMTQTLAGDQATAAQQSLQAAQSFGDAMLPIASAGEQLKAGVMGALNDIISAVPGVTAGFTSAGVAMTAFIAASSGLATVKKLMESLKLSSATLGPLAIAAAAVGVLVGAYTALKKEQEEQQRIARENVTKNQEAAKAHQEQAVNIQKMADRYQELRAKQRTVAEQDEFISLQNDLAAALGVTTDKILAQAASLDEWTKAIDAATNKERMAALEAAKEAEWDQTNIMLKAAADFARLGGESITATGGGRTVTHDWKPDPNSFEAFKEETLKQFDVAFDAISAKMITKGEEGLPPEVKGVFAQMMADGLFGEEAMDSLFSLGEDGIQATLLDVWNTLGDVDFSAVTKGTEGQMGLLQSFLGLDEAGQSAAAEQAQAYGESVLEALQPLFEAVGMTEESEQVGFLNDFILPIEMIEPSIAGTEAYANALSETAQQMGATATASKELQGSLDPVKKGFTDLGASIEATEKKIKGAKGAAGLIKDWQNAKKAMDSAKKGTAEWEKAVKSADKAAQKIGLSVDGSAESIEAADDAFASYARNLKAQEAAIVSEIESLENSLADLEGSSNIDGSASIDGAAAEEEIQRLKELLADLRAEMAAAGVSVGTSSKGGGGGGGGKKDDAAAEAERARKEALQRDYDLIAHKRHMNQITLEMELSMLQKIRREHKLTAEEIMAWEEKVYDVKQEIRARDAGSLDTIGDALITALTARYQAMLDAETERLDTSRRAWEDWRDGSVKAIQDQIDALDALAKTEDREKQDQEELRKIAKLRQDIEFEQDEYNRMKLQQQLEQAIESREERLRRLALEDAKDALRAEMAAIEERAEAELKALDEEQTAIEKAYAEQMKSAAIQAEAEKLLMANNQQELISLIGEYAPEYNALGKTLGEKLLDGFKQKTADVVKWFESLNKQLYAIQEAAAAEAIAASNALYAAHAQNQSAPATEIPAVTTVNQTVNFNEPVDSAGENARKLQRVNEELGAILNG